MKTFAGKKVIREIYNKEKEKFELAIRMRGFRACARAYKAADRSGTYVALIEEWGVNFHVPRWFRRWMLDGHDRFETNIATFDEAKKMSLKWLREICERDDMQKQGGGSEAMNRSVSGLIERISSNLTRAQHYQQEANNQRELEHLLWVSQDIVYLLSQWNDDKNEIDDHTAAAYAESGSHVAARIHVLVVQQEGR